MKDIRILLVDSDAEFLESLADLLARERGFHVVARSPSWEAARDLLSWAAPDVVLIELLLPGASGLEALRLVKADPAAPLVVVLTAHASAEHRAVARAGGADGFLHKSEAQIKLVPFLNALFGRRPGFP